MPILSLRNLDIYALLDADSDEAKAFTTYLGYWLCVAELIESRYGDPPYERLLGDLRARRPFRALVSKPPQCDMEKLAELLLNAWSSELALYAIDLKNTKSVWLENQWTVVKAYYATSRMATAWLVARDGQAPENHRGLLRAIASQLRNVRLYPSPWSLCCCAVCPEREYLGFERPPQSVHNLATNVEALDRYAMLLGTTRERAIKQTVEKVKADQKRERAPHGERARQDRKLEPTTVFDFAWRLRTRSNYGHPAMYYVGTLTPERSVEYAQAIRTFVAATMFLFEAFICQKARGLVEDMAVHFIARDRSRVAEALLAPRLRALGLLRSGQPAA